MTLFKKGTCSSKALISSFVYVCNKCGHTQMAKTASSEEKECPKCHSKMELISSHTEPK